MIRKSIEIWVGLPSSEDNRNAIETAFSVQKARESKLWGASGQTFVRLKRKMRAKPIN